MHKKIFFGTLFFIVVTTLSAGHDEEISRLYSREAGDLYTQGRFDIAGSCVRSALEFDERNSDALYLKGLMEYEIDGKAYTAARTMKRALDCNTWDLIPPVEAKKNAFRYLAESAEYKEALDLISMSSTILEEEPELLLLFIDACIMLGRSAEALRAVRFGGDAYAQDPRFMARNVQLDGDYRNSVITDVISDGGKEYPLLVIEQAILETADPGKKRILIEYYLGRGGMDMGIRIERLRFIPVTDLNLLDELVHDGLFTEWECLRSLIDYLQISEQMEYLQELFSGFSGTMLTERENGYTVRTRYEGGEITSIHRAMKGGTGTVEIGFSTEYPDTVRFVSPGEVRIFQYGGYPYLRSMDTYTEGITRTYIFPAGTFDADILVPLSNLLPVCGVSLQALDVTEEDLELMAERIITVEGEDRLTDYARTSGGEYILMESLRNVMDRIVLLRNGKPAGGRMDIDQDGRYETTIEYEKGIAERLLYDGNNNGIPEYIYFPAEPYLEEWDFDEDGFIDVRQYERDGTRFLEYRPDDGDGYTVFFRKDNQWFVQ